MSTKMLVTVKLDQRLMMSQQLRQAITLLQYNTLDLKQLVQQQLETNPLLEVDEVESEPDEDFSISSNSSEEQSQFGKYSANLSSRGRSYENESTLENYSIPQSLRDHLIEQTWLCQFDDAEQITAEAIIDAIDENGYLTMSLDDIQREISTSDNTSIESILNKIQTFDPVGIGARDIRECLLIQLNAFQQKNAVWTIAHDILNRCFDDVSTSNAKKIMKDLAISQQKYSEAIAVIRTLNPHPGLLYSSEVDINMEPELYVKKIKNEWCVFLSESILTNIKVNNQYQELIKQNKKHGSYQALKQELEEARGLINGLQRRNKTLLSVASYIMQAQQDFLEQGLTHMKSMNIIDVSQALEMHESTVSRVTTGKYIATPRGVFELKFFFPSGVHTKMGEMCSATAIKAHIKEIIHQEKEGHIFSDGEIADLLQKKGINVARRTIAKYREAMKILPSYQRMREQTFLAESSKEETTG